MFSYPATVPVPVPVPQAGAGAWTCPLCTYSNALRGNPRVPFCYHFAIYRVQSTVVFNSLPGAELFRQRRAVLGATSEKVVK